MLNTAITTKNYEDIDPRLVTKQVARRRHYTLSDIARHSSHYDCWVALFGRVLDLTPLLVKHQNELALPLIAAAGTDISDWFDEETRNPKRHIDPATGIEQPYTPQGRFIHIPPPYPSADWATNIETPWWLDEKYVIGHLTKKARKIRIRNLLVQHDVVLEVASEDTIKEIQARYLSENDHAGSYMWTRLEKPLDMERTLEENGIPDEEARLRTLGINPDDHIPALHLYFNDDLTVA
ncbi:flagellar associated protein [Besnoitia besnoiti]|uniref:Cytochrome b5 domain-containing protein 1 n=1 Tax=Besnoitia besnoiti TaxID=94643 RepID=A0A2A9MP39_BESBE|nr:flagellar associated protein [Besnoitia besnoiti]PFH38391.1 flagellar associated protein [Besnoitia besnoiti]